MNTIEKLKQVQERDKDNSAMTIDLSFLDKPDVVKSVARFIDDYNCEDAKTIGGDYYEAWKEVRTYPDAHKMYKTRCLKMAEYVVEAIKRMAKEGK